MDLLRIFELFPGQESCIAHLENIRFGDKPYCPLCGGLKIARKSDNYRIGRWNCYECGSSFNVLSGTIFQKTKIPLQKCFSQYQCSWMLRKVCPVISWLELESKPGFNMVFDAKDSFRNGL